MTMLTVTGQADSALSQRLGGGDFKEFLSQHEMTLVNFFAPCRNMATTRPIHRRNMAATRPQHGHTPRPAVQRSAALAATHRSRRFHSLGQGLPSGPERRTLAPRGCQGAAVAGPGAWPKSSIPLPLTLQVVRLVPPSRARLPRGDPHG